MKVLITGSNGFIGKHLVKSLLNINIEVIPFDISDGNDICNWESIKSIKDIDYIVHLASKTFVPHSYTYPRNFFHLSIVGTLNCLEYCRLNDSKLIYLSSYLYGEPDYLPVDEEHPTKAFNPYAASKLECENLCHYYYEFFKTKSIIFRPFNVYGEGQLKDFLIPTIINQAKQGDIYLKDGTPKRDYVYVEDLVSAITQALKNDTVEHDTFNIASGESYSVNEIVQLVLQQFKNGKKVYYEQAPRNNDVSDTRGNSSKIQKLLNWRPKVTISEGLKKMISN